MSSAAAPYGSAPPPDESLLSRGYGNTQSDSLHDSATNQHVKNLDHLAAAGLARPPSVPAAGTTTIGPSRSGTLRKKGSVRRTTSLRRSSSRKSLKAGSIKGLGDGDFDSRDFNSVFYTPIPTQGSPTEILADRFQAWRQLLKSLITYFREIQTSYETRAKAIHKVQNTLTNLTHPSIVTHGEGLAQATRILEDYHKRSLAEASKSRDIEEDVIGALSGLRTDLGQKIKEIKSLSGDFKNSVDKEQDSTRREVEKLQEALHLAEINDPSATGKHDPFVVRLGVDRAVERQIDEENYLHRAYLNLESSGRELESIVVGEIQKAYNALAGILKREGDDAYNAVEALRTGPISMPKDQEWMTFVVQDEHFVDPSVPLRRIEDIEYPGKHSPAAAEVRAGMLERKSKYLKSYTPGWYVLSPTHLHEFKSADKIYTQPPVMSLYLPDQRLGSKSELGSSSHKFMLKGKQSGSGHKGHNWVFRAESHDTMMAWYEAILVLTEKSPAEREAYVRQHARSVSGEHDRRTVSSDGFDEDEADATPFTGDVASLAENNPAPARPQRPQPGGRFPSDFRIPTSSSMAVAPSEQSDDSPQSNVAASALLLQPIAQASRGDPYRLEGIASHTRSTSNVPAVEAKSTYEDYYSSTGGQAHEQLPVPLVGVVERPVSPLSFDADPHTNQEIFDGPRLNQQDGPPDVTRAAPPIVAPQPLHSGWTHPALLVGPSAVSGTASGGTTTSQIEGSAPQAGTIEKEAGFSPATTLDAMAAPPIVATRLTGTSEIVPEQGSSSTDAGHHASLASTAIDATPIQSERHDSNELPLGGLERDGAHTTGRAIPVIRHDTNMSISGLHVPGQFPAGQL